MTDETLPALRRANVHDAAALARFHREVVLGTYSGVYPDEVLNHWARGHTSDRWRSTLSGNSVFILAEECEAIIGCGGLTNDRPGVYILPRVQRRGVGRSIFRELERLAYDREIPTLHLSAPLLAVPFYESMGFEIVGPGTRRFQGGIEMTIYDVLKSTHRGFKDDPK